MLLPKIKDIRDEFIRLYKEEQFTIDRTGAKTIEIIGATFICDEDYIIRKPSEEYIQRELVWYESQSLYVKDIPGKVPAIWEQIACSDGKINSNYGWCIFSNENGSQYDNVFCELSKNPDGRRATMIYTRPSMWKDYNENGRNDFMCTYANTFYIRDGKLISHYTMRSNDSVMGFNNDLAWAKYVQEKLAKDLGIKCGDIIWTSSNLHVYERHFKHIEEMI